MSNIHNYPLTATQINDEDYYDVDYWNGASYETRKISGATLKSVINALSSNIYNLDGTLTGDRLVTGDNFELFFQSLGGFIVHSHMNNMDNVVFEVRSDAVYHGFIVKDHNTGVHMLACRNGLVEISDAYFLPGADGTPGQVMVTDGAGNVAWQTLVDSDTNIYNTDGTLTGNRLVSMGGFGLAFQDASILMRLLPGANPQVILGGLTTPTNYPILEVIGISTHYGVRTLNDNGYWLSLVEGVNKLDLNGTLTADRNQTFQDADGIIALLSDIVNIFNSDGTLTGNRNIIGAGNSLSWLQLNGLLYQVETANPGQTAWEIDVNTTNMSGGDRLLKIYDINNLIERFSINRNGAVTFNSAFTFPTVDGTNGQVLKTNGAGGVSWQNESGSVEKKIDTFYAYDMSAAAAGGGTYTWNGTAVGSTTITTLNERYRLQIAAGVGQADGCFVNSILPSYYISNNNIRIDVVTTVNGTGGDYKIWVGLVKPNGANFGDASSTLWASAVITATAGFPMNKNTFTFNGVGLDPNEAIGILVYRDPGDAQDTYTGDIYINTINVQQV